MAHLRGDEGARAALRAALADHGIRASEVSRYELLVGARPRQRRALGSLFEALDWVPLDEPISSAAAALARRHGRGNPGIGFRDFVIAATAAVTEAELWTLNLKHFPMFPGLAPPY